uniref:Uncharacterized mitochondrial protein AtMg00810-like n=1 Tax=Tanacetum cinerariifolium TaxID=118510 RepID=A0A6L2MPP3_TANCI|nr:uncharacterized mitochondrial protein AtMg00810-like [Tanacetum cinerariifolium]
MRIEHYFLMTDYSLWEDAKTLMEAIEKMFGRNKETKKKLISQLEILRESLCQEDINLKFLRSLPTEWRTHTLIWRNKTDLEEQSLDDLFNSLKFYDAEVKSSSSASTSTQNIAFDITNEPVSGVAIVSAISAKILVSAFPNVDTLSNARTIRNLRANEPTLMGFDMSKVECYNYHRKGQFARKCRSPKDTKRNVSAEYQRRNVPVETSISNVLVSQCDGLGSYNWSFQAEEDPTKYALMAFTSSSSSSSDNKVASCSKGCTKAYATLQSYYDKLTNDLRKSQFDVISYKAGLEYVEARLLVYQQNKTAFEEDIKLLKLDVQLRDNALVVLKQKFKKAEQERDELKLKLEKFQTSSKNLSQLLANQTNDKTELGYYTQVFTSSMFNCNEMFSSATDASLPASPIYDRYQSREGYHDVPPPYTGTFMLPKPDLVFHDAPNVNETIHTAFNVELSPTKPDKYLSHTHRPSAPIIEDWISDLEDDSKAELSQNTPSFVQPIEQVKTPRPSIKLVENSIPAANHKTAIPKPKTHGNNKNKKACFVPRLAKTVITKPHSPPRRNINRRLSPKPSNFPPKVTTVKAPKVNVVKGVQGNWGNPHHALKDKGVIDSGCSRYMTRNMSYLSDFEAINGGYVAFGGNLKGGKITGKGKIRTVLLRVHRENNMYNVDLKNIVPSGDSTCLFAKETLDESNLWHRRLGHINFKTMNKLVKGNLVRGLPSKVFENNHTRVACKKGKQHRASYNTKPVSSVSQPLQRVLVITPHNKTPYELLLGRTPSIGFMRPFGCHVTILNTLDPLGSGPTWLFDIDTLIKSMNYQPVTAGNQYNPSVGVQEQFDAGKAGEDNVQQYVLFPLWSSGSKDPQNTDGVATFEVKEPEFEVEKPESEVYVFPSSTLEDITYFDDKEDVDAEADFTNLETNITHSPIPITRVHKDHHVTQIIGDLSLATQTRSMTRVVKDQDLCKAFEKLMKDKFRMSSMGELTFFLGLQAKQKPDGIFISQDKYVAEILRKFGLTDKKSASTRIDTEKPLLKDPDGENVDVHTYRSMIGSLMYLTSSRLDIMFAVYACARFQVTPKVSHLHAVKRIFRYLKGKPHLGLWYPKDSPFNLVAYSDSDYDGASLDRKSKTGGCQFFGYILISWQCKKQTVVATLSTEAEYVVAASCYTQVL